MSTIVNTKKIAVIHNLTSGGGVRVLNETNKLLSLKYNIKIFSPPKIKFGGNSGLRKTIRYLHYVYKILPDYYKMISSEINDGGFCAAVVHPDTYTKAPFLLPFIKVKSIYILHEPPREFYEPLYFHAPTVKDKFFTILRVPIWVIDKIISKKATYIVANSKFSRKKIDQIYGVHSKVIYPGTNSLYKKTSRKIRRKYLCLSIGSLLPYKGHELTIEAIGNMSKKPGLTIVGNGREKEKSRLKELARKQGVQLRIVNKISDKKLKSLYKSSRVYINSAYQEPFGLTSLEALNFGENLVTVNKCGTEELKKFFGEKVEIVRRTPTSISKGIDKMIFLRNKTTKLPDIFSWKNYVKELMTLIEN